MIHYGIPEKLISIIKETNRGMTCNVLHEGKNTYLLEVKTGVIHGCILSSISVSDGH